MRPELLELEGFTTFRERTTVDFSGADLFALVGATGAGKSSVVDAICFALYGVVPRYDDRRLVAPVISEGALEAKVRLDFSVGDERYSAVRVVRAQVSKASGQRAGATTKEARLVRLVGATAGAAATAPPPAGEAPSDGEPDEAAASYEVLAGTADELSAAVEELLGLSFAHFTTCVVLPQGEFMRFLHAKPADRQSLLVELLDMGLYGRMRALAREREMAARARKEMAERQLADVATSADPARLARASHAIGALAEVLEGIDAAQDRLDELAKQAEVAVAAARAARANAQAVAAISPPDDLPELSELLSAARAAVERASRDEDELTAAAGAAEAALGALADRGELEALAAAHAERNGLVERITKGSLVVAEAASAHLKAQAALEAAGATAAEAAGALDEARRSRAAHELALGLHAGDTCPVCGSEVGDLPAHEGTDLADAMARAEGAKASKENAEASLRATQADLARFEAHLAQLLQQATELDARLARSPSAEQVPALLAELGAAEQALAEARKAVAAARDARKAAERQLTQAEERRTRAGQALAARRDPVAALGPPVPEGRSIADDWAALVAWAMEQAPGLEAEATAADSAAVAAGSQAQALADELTSRAAAAGVVVGGRLLRDAVVDRLGELRSEADALSKAIASLERLEAERLEQGEAEAVATALARHLGATGFEKWVLDEVLLRLVHSATGVLHELSGGAYSLTLDPKTSNFCVVDHSNADSVRSARTLSGGETFLASLALALAMAEQVAQLAPGGSARLESMFLDEGFGTLDADTLDTVAAAIEELGSRGRMVGLISHVPELAERLPVRFEVRKGPAGSTVERVDR